MNRPQMVPSSVDAVLMERGASSTRTPPPRLPFLGIFPNFGFGWTAEPGTRIPLRYSRSAPSLTNGGAEPAADVQPGVRGTLSRACSSSRPR